MLNASGEHPPPNPSFQKQVAIQGFRAPGARGRNGLYYLFIKCLLSGVQSNWCFQFSGFIGSIKGGGREGGCVFSI